MPRYNKCKLKESLDFKDNINKRNDSKFNELIRLVDYSITSDEGDINLNL